MIVVESCTTASGIVEVGKQPRLASSLDMGVALSGAVSRHCLLFVIGSALIQGATSSGDQLSPGSGLVRVVIVASS